VKIGHRNFSNNAVSDLKENIGQLKMAQISEFTYPYSPSSIRSAHYFIFMINYNVGFHPSKKE